MIANWSFLSLCFLMVLNNTSAKLFPLNFYAHALYCVDCIQALYARLPSQYISYNSPYTEDYLADNHKKIPFALLLAKFHTY